METGNIYWPGFQTSDEWTKLLRSTIFVRQGTIEAAEILISSGAKIILATWNATIATGKHTSTIWHEIFDDKCEILRLKSGLP